MSSTTVRPRRTFLHTATGARSQTESRVASVWTQNTQNTRRPSTHHHWHVIPNTQSLVERLICTDHADQHGEPHDHGCREHLNSDRPKIIQSQRAGWEPCEQLWFNSTELIDLLSSPTLLLPCLVPLFALLHRWVQGWRGVRCFGLATCGTFQMQPRGREGKGGEEEREKGEFSNLCVQKKKQQPSNQAGLQSYASVARKVRGLKGECYSWRGTIKRWKLAPRKVKEEAVKWRDEKHIEKKEKLENPKGESGCAYRSDSARWEDSDGAYGLG